MEQTYDSMIDIALTFIKHSITEVLGFGLVGLIIGLLTRKVVQHGFDKLIVNLTETFKAAINDNIVPLIGISMESARKDVLNVVEKWTVHYPSLVGQQLQPVVTADIKSYVDAGDFDGAYKVIDSDNNDKSRASQYKELARICMSLKDKLNCFKAVNKYRELEGHTPEAYRFLGYTYWWFDDVDTAIVHTENALGLAMKSTEDSREENIAKIKNNLAFYYADKGINKDTAFTYIKESLSSSTSQNKTYIIRLDTHGYVYYKFGTTKDEIHKAIKIFNQALELDPLDKDTIQHLTDAYQKLQTVA